MTGPRPRPRSLCRAARAVAPVLGLALVAAALDGCGGPSSTDDRTHGSAAGRPSPGASHASSAPTAPGAGTPTAAAPTHLVVRGTRPRLPYQVARQAVDPLGDGRFLVAGGLLAGDASTNRAFVLDTGRSTTRPAPPMPVPVHDTAGIVLHGRPLVVGGGNSSEQSVVQERGAGGWRVAGHLPQPRSDLSAVATGGRGLVLGGYDGGATAQAQVLSGDGAHWRVVGTLPLPVRYAASAVVGGRVWLFGGERAGVEQDAVQVVDARGHARVVAHLPVPTGHAAAVPLGGRILLVGGRTTSDHVTDRMWWFDPATRPVTPAGRLPVPLADAGVALGTGAQGDTAWLLGGETPGLTDRVLRVALR